MKLSPTAVSLALCGVMPTTASASGEQVRFSWVRAEGAEACATQQSMEERVRQRLGRNPFAAEARRSIEATVAHSDGQWTAVLYVRTDDGGAGVRQLDSRTTRCAPIEDAAVLAIALAIDPEEALRPQAVAPPQPPPATSAPPPPPTVVLPASRTRVPPTPVSGQRLRRGSVAVRALGNVGVLPSPTLGAAWSVVTSSSGPLSFSTGAMWLPERKTESGVAAMGITAGWAGVCARPSAEPVAFRVCGVGYAGAIHAVTYRYQPLAPGDRFWAAFALQPSVLWELAETWVLEAGLEAMAPAVRHEFKVVGAEGLAFQQPVVALSAWFGAGLLF